MKKIVLACLAIAVPLGAAHADSWKNQTMKPSPSMTIRGRVVCLSNANCWCTSKRKTLTPGEPCACGSASGVLKYEAQVGGVASCQ